MTAQECRIARENRDKIKERGAVSVLIKERPEHPNKVEVWASTSEDLNQATEYYHKLCGNHDD